MAIKLERYICSLDDERLGALLVALRLQPPNPRFARALGIATREREGRDQWEQALLWSEDDEED